MREGEYEALLRLCAEARSEADSLRNQIDHLGVIVGVPDAAANVTALEQRLASLMMVAGWAPNSA